MCGICGIALPRGSARRLDEPTLVRMRDTMVHRGPDGAGAFLADGIALGHRRLSIVDVAHGAQPMRSDDGALTIVYNGEVYNHPLLQARLEGEGVRYHTRCDTETVLHVFERERERAPEALRGMFAFAVWDARRRELVLARDRLGVKPLYYVHTSDGALYFASEIKALVAAGAVQPTLNLTALPDYLANHGTSDDETLFAGVRRLAPGHTLTWRDGAVVIRRYWDLSFARGESAFRSERDVVAEYRERFRESVRMRLMADVPLGVFLSGGIDSSAIAAVMSELVDDRIKTFSVAFAEREANELAYARMVAGKWNTDHHEVVVSPDAFWNALPSLLWHEDEPIAHPSSIALNFVSRLAAQHVKVVLTGEGSDEAMAGYGRYRTTLLNLQLGRAWEAATPRALRAGVRRAVGALPPSRARAVLSRTFLARGAGVDALYFDNFAVFDRARQRRLLAPSIGAVIGGVDPYAAHRQHMSSADSATLLDRFLYADTKTYLHELLMKQDQMSMAASIESRVPFLDHELLGFVAGLPQRYKLRGRTTKWLLREAMRDVLPAPILSRAKMGFPVPIGAWLRGAQRNLVDEYVLGARALARGLFDAGELRRLAAAHASGAEEHGQRLWSLINLELWHRIFVDREDPAHLEHPCSPLADSTTPAS